MRKHIDVKSPIISLNHTSTLNQMKFDHKVSLQPIQPFFSEFQVTGAYGQGTVTVATE